MKRIAALASMLLLLAACGGGGATKDAPKATPTATNGGTEPSPPAQDWHPTIKTATLPDDPCALLTVAEVEAVMGKLAAPPRKQDGCRYTLVIPGAVAAKRQQATEMREKFAKALSAYGKPDDDAASKRSDKMFAEEQDPKSYAVTVSVDVKGEVAGERAMDSVSKQLGLTTENDPAKPQEVPAKAANDWDDVRRISGFMGRMGHVRISVERQSSDVPREQLQALAERVRDKIPDLPFAVTNPYQVMQLGTSGDPCSLLTRAEAESVLGPLAIEPYRSSSNWPPLAHGKGYACAYYRPGHHVFVLSPTWSGGAQSFKLEKGIGGLVGIAMPQENVVFRGPWEQSHTGMTGELLFLKGDRLLTVHYLTSRATRGEAVNLAAIAMKRLAP